MFTSLGTSRHLVIRFTMRWGGGKPYTPGFTEEVAAAVWGVYHEAVFPRPRDGFGGVRPKPKNCSGEDSEAWLLRPFFSRSTSLWRGRRLHAVSSPGSRRGSRHRGRFPGAEAATESGSVVCPQPPGRGSAGSHPGLRPPRPLALCSRWRRAGRPRGGAARPGRRWRRSTDGGRVATLPVGEAAGTEALPSPERVKVPRRLRRATEG